MRLIAGKEGAFQMIITNGLQPLQGSEAACAKAFDEKGWTVIKGGWPDFLMMPPNLREPDPVFVEAKDRPRRELEPSQQALFSALQQLGFSVHFWCRDRGLGLIEISDSHWDIHRDSQTDEEVWRPVPDVLQVFGKIK